MSEVSLLGRAARGIAFVVLALLVMIPLLLLFAGELLWWQVFRQRDEPRASA